ncbi:hypothetical protein KBC89_00540 [Candidatus Woesebacteria bacterium]|nr:hypothetical protein [Candidatus Woesebacteria bacterium]
MFQTEILQSDREVSRLYTAGLSEALDTNPPNSWWRSIAYKIIFFERHLGEIQSAPIRDHIQIKIAELKLILRNSQYLPMKSPLDIVEYTEKIIMSLSMEMALIFEETREPIGEHIVSLDTLVDNYPQRLRKKESVLNGTSVINLEIRHPDPVIDQWYSIPIPNQKMIWHKGGPARALLNLIADAPLSMQIAEFPWNDFDVITAGNDVYDTAISIGVDPDGVEYMGENTLNFSRFAYGRDTDQNQCCLGSDGLHYSTAALKAAQTGHINLVGKYIANKAIYGVDSMYYEGISLIKPRGLMRLVKNLVEGKAISFDYKPINANFDIGIYVLFLAKKWSKRSNFPELLQKLFVLLQQMGQVRSGENSIIDVLERAHKTYPFFDFDREIETKTDLTQWKAKKIVKQFDRELAWLFDFPTTLELTRSINDMEPITISLDSYSISDTASSEIEKWWEDYLNQSKARTAQFESIGITQYQRIFMKNDNLFFDDTTGIIDED